jgi:hypothetical protein
MVEAQQMTNPPEEYHAWFAFWINLLYGSLSLFVLVAMVVTVKGWHEIKVMLSRLKADADAQDASQE